MSKRKTTPELPSMDDLLGSQPDPVEEKRPLTPKSLDSQKSEKKSKVTYYFPLELVERIDDAHYQISRLTRGSKQKIHKYDMARVAWELILNDFEKEGENSVLVRLLLGDDPTS